jgi:putative ABC transport system permease protein
MVTAGLFPLLGVSPEIGRWFTPDEEKPGAAEGKDAVILSHRLWEQRFGADRTIIERTIELDHASYTLIGVMPAGFTFPIEETPVDIWVTIALDARGEDANDTMLAQRGVNYLETIARMKPDAALSQAQGADKRDCEGIEQAVPGGGARRTCARRA